MHNKSTTKQPLLKFRSMMFSLNLILQPYQLFLNFLLRRIFNTISGGIRQIIQYNLAFSILLKLIEKLAVQIAVKVFEGDFTLWNGLFYLLVDWDLCAWNAAAYTGTWVGLDFWTLCPFVLLEEELPQGLETVGYWAVY